MTMQTQRHDEPIDWDQPAVGLLRAQNCMRNGVSAEHARDFDEAWQRNIAETLQVDCTVSVKQHADPNQLSQCHCLQHPRHAMPQPLEQRMARLKPCRSCSCSLRSTHDALFSASSWCGSFVVIASSSRFAKHGDAAAPHLPHAKYHHQMLGCRVSHCNFVVHACLASHM